MEVPTVREEIAESEQHHLSTPQLVVKKGLQAGCGSSRRGALDLLLCEGAGERQGVRGDASITEGEELLLDSRVALE